MIVVKICKHCSSEFSFESGPGKHNVFCDKKCSAKYFTEKRPDRKLWAKCKTEGCCSTVRSYGAEICNTHYTLERKNRAGVCSVHKCERAATRDKWTICETHYYRIRRSKNPSVKIRPPRIDTYHTQGYVLKFVGKGERFAHKNGYAFEHRLNAFEKYGEGPHDCFWCGKILDWDKIVIDHVNEQKADNRHENLLVSCSPCNRARGAMIDFIRRLKPERTLDLVDTFQHMRNDLFRK
jgi:hypothetical protein